MDGRKWVAVGHGKCCFEGTGDLTPETFRESPRQAGPLKILAKSFRVGGGVWLARHAAFLLRLDISSGLRQ